jgi:hypothetical protein
LIEKEDLSDLDDEDLIHLIRRLERIQKHAKYPTILVSGKSIELTNLEKLNQLIKQLRSRVSEKRMSEADETKEEAVIRELKEMGIRIEPKLSGESKRLLGEIRSDKSKIFTAYKVEKFKKDIKEATIAWLKEKMEQKKVDKDKNLSRYKKLSSNSQKVYSDKAISSPFGGGKKFESIPEITKKILEDIEKTSSEYKK